MSGPPEVQYSSIRRSPPVGSYQDPRHFSNASDPSFSKERRREVDLADSEESSEEGSTDELGNGVRVEPERVERREVVAVPSRKPVGKKKGRR
jgi:hypothetical protein